MRCHAVARRTGDPCLFPARSSHAYCINHDPEYRLRQRENTRKGGLASALTRSAADSASLRLWIGDRAGIQAALDAVIRLELHGRISPARSRNVLRALAIAARNFNDPNRPVEPYDADDYGVFRELIDEGLDDALDEAAARDEAPPPPERAPRRLTLAEIWAGRT